MGESAKEPALGRREVITLVCLIVFFGFLYEVATPNFIGQKRSGPGWNANACINNLRRIDGAKQYWALENGKTNGDIVVTRSISNPTWDAMLMEIFHNAHPAVNIPSEN
jgi:hypothetical protein